jgi:thymidylate synthase
MYYLNCSTCFEEEYRKTLKKILDVGRIRKVRGYDTKELSPYVWTTSYPLRNILTNKYRKINTGFMAAEFLWLLSGRNDLEMIGCYNSKIKKFSDNLVSMRGAYGPKIYNQLDYVIKTLSDDKGSRQAIISIWEVHPTPSRDIPCTLSMQFIVDDTLNALDLVVTMRSNDAWLGLPYDVFNFTMILNYVAMRLRLSIGRYTHQSCSEHLYDEHYHIAKSASDDQFVLVGDIEESLPFEHDDLPSIMLFEKQMRNLFVANKLELFDIEQAKKELDVSWFNLLEMMHEHLINKNKKQ